MQCFSAAWFENFLIWLAVVIFIIACIKLVIPALIGWIGAPPGGGIIITLLGYFLWLVLAVAIIIFVFDLISCLSASGGLRLPGR